MTSLRSATLALVTLTALASCGSPAERNPPRLWLSLIGPESAGVMGLVESEPIPY